MEIRWSAPEYHHYEKSVAWYWIVGIVTIAIIGFSLWQKNFLFAIFAVIAALLVVSWGKRAPRTIDFALSEQGFDIGGEKFYKLEDLAGFAIIPDAHGNEALKELVFQTRARLNVWVRAIIAADREPDIRELLAPRLPEVDYTPSLAEHIVRLLRF